MPLHWSWYLIVYFCAILLWRTIHCLLFGFPLSCLPLSSILFFLNIRNGDAVIYTEWRVVMDKKDSEPLQSLQTAEQWKNPAVLLLQQNPSHSGNQVCDKSSKMALKSQDYMEVGTLSDSMNILTKATVDKITAYVIDWHSYLYQTMQMSGEMKEEIN